MNEYIKNCGKIGEVSNFSREYIKFQKVCVHLKYKNWSVFFFFISLLQHEKKSYVEPVEPVGKCQFLKSFYYGW